MSEKLKTTVSFSEMSPTTLAYLKRDCYHYVDVPSIYAHSDTMLDLQLMEHKRELSEAIDKYVETLPISERYEFRSAWSNLSYFACHCGNS